LFDEIILYYDARSKKHQNETTFSQVNYLLLYEHIVNLERIL